MTATDKVRYQDIKADVLHRIRNNSWPPGSIIPGEVELAEKFGCARSTVNRAMRELAEDGYLDRKRKAGTRVKSTPTRQAKFTIPLIRHEIIGLGATYRYALVNRDIPKTPDWLRARLGLSKDARTLHIQCMHYAGAKPFQYEDRWINLQAVPGAEYNDFSTIGPNDWLVKTIPFSDVELTFSAANAELKIAQMLDIAEDTAVFTVERITWLEGLPVTYAKLYFGEGYQMTTRL